jgi:hypothetical protein
MTTQMRLTKELKALREEYLISMNEQKEANSLYDLLLKVQKQLKGQKLRKSPKRVLKV